MSNNNNNLKIHLQKLDKSIVFQIIKQTDLPYNGLSFDIDGIQVRFNKVNVPEISLINKYGEIGSSQESIIPSNFNPHKINIFLRSNKYKDFSICILPFEDINERDKIYNVILKAFKRLRKELVDTPRVFLW